MSLGTGNTRSIGPFAFEGPVVWQARLTWKQTMIYSGSSLSIVNTFADVSQKPEAMNNTKLSICLSLCIHTHDRNHIL